MLARDLLGQRQAQPGALGAAADQRQEQMLGQVFGHATAVIGDFQPQRQRVQLIGDAHAVLNARAQGDGARTGLDRIADQVPHRLGEPVRIAIELGNAGVVIALDPDRPATLALGQAQYAFQRGMNVERCMWRGRRG
ncbi:hypothetical protein D3C71_897740 [compost metagenome]